MELGRAAAAVLAAAFPHAIVIGCSSAGEIGTGGTGDGMLSLLGIRFDRTAVRAAWVPHEATDCSFVAGRAIAARLAALP